MSKRPSWKSLITATQCTDFGCVRRHLKRRMCRGEHPSGIEIEEAEEEEDDVDDEEEEEDEEEEDEFVLLNEL